MAEPHDNPDKPADASRRLFLNLGMAALGVAGASVVVVPGVAYLLAPLGREHGEEVGYIPTYDRSMFPPGEPVKVELVADKIDGWNADKDVKLGAAWVVALDDELIAISTVCPHLGCAIDYDPSERKFKCPCHRSAFALDGTPEYGPSPRALDRLDVRVADRLVEIRYQTFKTGISEKVPT